MNTQARAREWDVGLHEGYDVSEHFRQLNPDLCGTKYDIGRMYDETYN